MYSSEFLIKRQYVPVECSFFDESDAMASTCISVTSIEQAVFMRRGMYLFAGVGLCQFVDKPGSNAINTKNRDSTAVAVQREWTRQSAVP